MNQFLLIVFFAVASLTIAASSNATTISWAEAVRRTDSDNPEIAAARESLRSAEGKKMAAYSGFLPSVSADVGYELTERSGTSSVASVTGTGWTAGVNASWNLFSGFLDEAKIKRAEADRRAAEEGLRLARSKASNDLKTAFETVAYARDYTRLTAQILKRREENYRLVQLRYESGRENKGSVLLSEAYLEQARLDDLQAKNALRTSSVSLAKIMAADGAGTETFEVVGNVPLSEPAKSMPDFESLVLVTPEYTQSVEQAKSLEEARRVARASFFPSLDLTSGIRRRDEKFFPTETQTKTFEVTLTIPLFSGGKDLGTYRAAVAAASSSAYSRDNTLRDVRRKLEEAWAKYTESVARLRADESFKKAATVRSEIGRAKYNNGLLSFDDWDVIENDLISREKTVLETRRDRATAEAAWEQAQGKGVWP